MKKSKAKKGGEPLLAFGLYMSGVYARQMNKLIRYARPAYMYGRGENSFFCLPRI